MRKHPILQEAELIRQGKLVIEPGNDPIPQMTPEERRNLPEIFQMPDLSKPIPTFEDMNPDLA